MIFRVKAKFEKVSFDRYVTDLINSRSVYFLEQLREYCEITKRDLKETALMLHGDTLKKIYDNIKCPKRATVGSAGYDFFAPVEFSIPTSSNGSVLVPTGIRCKMEEPNMVLSIYPRSGLGFKHKVGLNNTVGIIDQDYYYSDNEGHIMIKLSRNSSASDELKIETGEAFAQGIFTHYYITEDDDVTEIRNGGFGSTTQTQRKE